MKAAPTTDEILSTLIELYADQKGVKVEYEIHKEEQK